MTILYMLFLSALLITQAISKQKFKKFQQYTDDHKKKVPPNIITPTAMVLERVMQILDQQCSGLGKNITTIKQYFTPYDGSFCFYIVYKAQNTYLTTFAVWRSDAQNRDAQIIKLNMYEKEEDRLKQLQNYHLENHQQDGQVCQKFDIMPIYHHYFERNPQQKFQNNFQYLKDQCAQVKKHSQSYLKQNQNELSKSSNAKPKAGLKSLNIASQNGQAPNKNIRQNVQTIKKKADSSQTESNKKQENIAKSSQNYKDERQLSSNSNLRPFKS